MENLIFSLNATLPVFLLMILGIVFRKLNIVSQSFAKQLNSFVFLIPLPVMVFKNLATIYIQTSWNTKFVLFCFGVTLLSILISFLISILLKEENKGEFIQVSYRSSAALLGMALIQNIYGDSIMGPLMIIGSVPLYNIVAVIVLSFFKPGVHSIDQQLIKKTCFGILKNPIIIGILIGILYSFFRLPYPPVLSKTIDYISALASPLGLIAMGASFNFEKAKGSLKSAVIASFMKLFGFCILFIPLAIHFGFVQDQMVAILIMLGSASTVTCYVMAKNMGHEGTLSSTVVMLTTLFSGFSITFWLFILKSIGVL
ncbi:MAG: AEC family transporter [Floccifex sp.]